MNLDTTLSTSPWAVMINQSQPVTPRGAFEGNFQVSPYGSFEGNFLTAGFEINM